MITRRVTPTVKIGDILMGSEHPVVVQSMTDVPTANVAATVSQIKELVDAGSELVRITVNDRAAMDAVLHIDRSLKNDGYDVPIAGDFHYNGHKLLKENIPAAKALAKYRINPGNTGKGSIKYDNFSTIINIAAELGKPVRIGINWGSLDQELFLSMMSENEKRKKPLEFKEVVYAAMVRSALENAAMAEKMGLSKDKIVLSVKMSDVIDMKNVYEILAEKCDYVLHLGLTEAGGSIQGVVASSAALSLLLQHGIGDTIRVSLTPEPGMKRDMEVRVCRSLLQSMGIRYFMPVVISCPGCGRTDSDAYIRLADDVRKYIGSRINEWKNLYSGIEKLQVAVMGCIVNGPGESKHADIGISLPGSSEAPVCPVYQDGKLMFNLSGNNIKDQFFNVLEEYIKMRFS
ncbi:MAG: flavodoxin-dependent (E)-4-hydroxy-3-methylbut-2-enyl-diphosphate synthase [bacterium]|nr:flavodoxin-dependent (E)-4-hydroxy-3-methylbut-2-enyl-diphosphate synthase [bacterium]